MATKNDIYAKIGIFVIGLINFILFFATSLAPSLPLKWPTWASLRC